MQPLTFDAYTARLRERLAGSLPGQEAQRLMAPEHRRDLSPAAACREAGVLVLLFPMEGAPALVLTVRHARLSQHAGQISFPGGRREADEDLRTTALREAYEEIGLLPSSVTVLGALSPLYIPPSNYCVYPFVGMVPQVPTFRPHDDEVEAILHVPVAQLLEPGRRRREQWTLRGQPVMVPFFAIGDHKIWGATAMMLAELVALS